MTPRTSLDDGQVVTLLVGVGLELVNLHHSDRAYGPLHPAHVRVDGQGRPHLADVPPPPGWTAHDDWVALLRLGRFVGRSERSRLLSWDVTGQREGRELLRWLMEWDTPKPLPA